MAKIWQAVFTAQYGPMGTNHYRWDDHMLYFPFGWLGLFGVLAIIIAIFVVLARKGASMRFRQTPLDILSKRYARGEIDREQYQQMKEDLSGEKE